MNDIQYDKRPPPPPPIDNISAPPPPPPFNEKPPPPPKYVPVPPPPAEIPPPPPTDIPRPPDVVPPKKKPGWGSQPSKTPLSVEEILKKKRDADEAAKKPKFLSKAAREKLVLEKQQREIDEQKRKEEAEREARLAPKSRPQLNGGSKSVANGSSTVPSGPRAFRDGGAPPGPSSTRPKGGPKQTKNGPEILSSKKRGPETAEEIIRHRYMGQDTNTSTFSASKKRKRTTEKKFNFEWNLDEDTSPDYNPLYASKAQVSLYGRGKLGGFDDTAVEDGANSYAKAVALRDGAAGSTRAQEILDMERRRKEGDYVARNAIDKHWSEKKVDQMRERDWRIFKEDFNIAVKGGGIPNPMRSWEESGLPQRLLDIVSQVGYTEPSAIQRAAIPIALQARDIIGVAMTGSGKTAAFVLPLLVYISTLPPLDEYTKNDGPYAIVLAPTRELAQQIEVEAKKFAIPFGFTVVSIVGGHSLEEQSYAMRDGAEIVIATPGRLVDCIERQVLVLSQCCYVIMDEADRMIDLGFEESVNKILDALPVGNLKPDTDEAENGALMKQGLYGGKEKYRLTMMYTATMPAAIERIARKYLRRPAIVTIGNAGEAVETVEQRVEFVTGEEKRKKRLADILLSREYRPPVIVFVNIKRNCDAIARDIKHIGFSTVTLHGSKTQDQREAALASVRNGQTEVLVATDLAGRGIDVPDVSLVVNFNMAGSIESYTHRIGRTGRAGKSGTAITFLGPEDNDVLYDLKQMLSKSEISRIPEELRRHESAQQKPQKGGGVKKEENSFGAKPRGGY